MSEQVIKYRGRMPFLSRKVPPEKLLSILALIQSTREMCILQRILGNLIFNAIPEINDETLR